MGLDMYLYRKTYVQNWDHNKENYQVTVTKGGKPTSIDPKKVTYVIEQAGYWRKANAIHKWFVYNVQDGKDDCGEYYVSPEKMEKLLNICKDVLANPSRANELLSTTNGFFFGGTEYNEYYLSDLEQTVQILTEAVEDYDNGADGSSYYYQSSW